jgi:phage protein U
MIGSIPGASLSSAAEVALARALSLTPFVGFIGKTVFMTSRFFVRTFENKLHKTSVQFAEHPVILGKPIPEFTGQQLDDIELDIVLHGGHGIEPLIDVHRLQQETARGNSQPVFLNAKYYGEYTISSMESEETHWHRGRPIVIKVSLSLREYVESIPVEAQMKLRQAELSRVDTGLGGPQKLAGTASVQPTQARILTPQIDSVTRMVVS